MSDDDVLRSKIRDLQDEVVYLENRYRRCRIELDEALDDNTYLRQRLAAMTASHDVPR